MPIAKSKEQRAKSKEQRAKSKEQRAKSIQTLGRLVSIAKVMAIPH